jgi:integrase
LAKKTRQQYANVAKQLRKFFEGASIDIIKPPHIAMWMDEHYSKIQANTGLAILRNVFEIAVRYGALEHNFAKDIGYHNIAGRDRLISDAEYLAIWDVAQPHIRIAMDIGYLTGSRVQDILDIRLQDVTDEGTFIMQGKTKKKILFLRSDAMDEIVGRARALPRPIRGMHLLCNKYGKPYPYRTINADWLKAVRSVGVKDVHFHDIRAKAATDAKAQGMDYQSLLGHSSKAMSDRYVKLREISRVETLNRKIGRSST